MARTKNAELDLDELLSDSGDIKENKKERATAVKTDEVIESYIYELVGNYPIKDGNVRFPAIVTLPNTDTVVDSITGQYRTIRYLTGVHSIYLEDQKDIDDKAVKRLTPKRFQFDNGRMVVDAKDRAQVEFLDLSGRNQAIEKKAQGCYTMYRLVDDKKAEQAKLDDIKLRRRAAGLAEDASDEDMLIHADYLGIRDTTDAGQKKSINGVRADYIIYAQSNPNVFIKSHNNPLAKVYVSIRKAIMGGTITTTHVKGQAHWGETKSLIITFPEGAAEVDFLAKYALTTDGKSFKERLQEL